MEADIDHSSVAEKYERFIIIKLARIAASAPLITAAFLSRRPLICNILTAV